MMDDPLWMILLSNLDLAYFCFVSHISVPAGQNIDNGKRPYFIISGLYEFHLWDYYVFHHFTKMRFW